MTGHGKRLLNVSVLFRGCGFEICEWLLADSITKKELTYPRSGSKSKGANCRNWDMLAVFGSRCKKKVAMHSPGKRRYRVDMLVDTWNGSLRHVCSRECIPCILDPHILVYFGIHHPIFEGTRCGSIPLPFWSLWQSPGCHVDHHFQESHRSSGQRHRKKNSRMKENLGSAGYSATAVFFLP